MSIIIMHSDTWKQMTDESRRYYVPHHAVRNDNSVSTKLRVVFDVSAETSANTRLNDVLLKGPYMQSCMIYRLLSCDSEIILERKELFSSLYMYIIWRKTRINFSKQVYIFFFFERFEYKKEKLKCL